MKDKTSMRASLIDTAEGSSLTESKNDLQANSARKLNSFGSFTPGSKIVLVTNGGKEIKILNSEVL